MSKVNKVARQLKITEASRIMAYLRRTGARIRDRKRRVGYTIRRSGTPICGIYVITDIKTNRRYVGQSVDCTERFKSHMEQLGSGRGNPNFQAVYDESGNESFRLSIAEECSPDQLNEKEMEWMAIVRPELNRIMPDFSKPLDGFNVLTMPKVIQVLA